MSDPTQPADADATTAIPTPAPAAQVRTPFEITKFMTRRSGLQVVGTKRSGMGYEQIAADALIDEMYELLVAQHRTIVSYAKGKERTHGLLQKEQRRAKALEEQLERRDADGKAMPQRPPIQAVDAVSGGQQHSEKLIVNAEAHAARLIAHAEAEAGRIVSSAVAPIGPPARPEPTSPEGVLALASWLPAAVIAAQDHLNALKTAVPVAEQQLIDLRTERDSWAQILPLAGAAITAGKALDVTEVDLTDDTTEPVAEAS